MPVNYERKTIDETIIVDLDLCWRKVSDILPQFLNLDEDFRLEWDDFDCEYVAVKQIERLETDVEYDARIAEEEKKERKRLEKAVSKENITRLKAEKELNERKALYELLKKEFDGDV